MIVDNQQMTVNEVAHHLCISNGSAQEIIQDQLWFHKVCTRWVQKQLTGEHKPNCLTNCYYNNKSDTFLRLLSLVTRHVATITLQKVNDRVRNGNVGHHQSKGDSELNHRWEK
jgi:hypothetical protein